MKKSLLFLSAFLLLGSLKAEDILYNAIAPFGGLNNSDSPLVIPANKAQDLLNVDVSPGGKSILKRKGYALFSNLTITTSAVHGIHNFFDSSGNSVDLYFHDQYISASVGGSAVSVLSSTASEAATWQCVDSQGFAYCNNTGRTSLLKTNGVTFSNITTVNSTGTMVAITPERLATAGFAEATNRIDVSKANDFTYWVIGSQATDAAQFTIVSPGSRLTHIVYAFGRIIWFKDSSFGFLYIGGEAAQADWEVKIIDPQVGTLDNTSVYREGMLYFRGQDGHIYAYDGSSLTKLTRDLEGTISVSGNRTVNSWTQTSQSDFQTSSITPSGYLSTTINSGSVVLATAAAISDFTDDSASDFGSASSVVKLDTTTLSGSVFMSTATSVLSPTTPITTNVYFDPSTSEKYGAIGTLDGIAQSFVSTYTYLVSSVTLYMSGSVGGLNTVYLRADSGSNTPGEVLISTVHAFINLPAFPTGGFETIIFQSSVVIVSGARYWIHIVDDGGESPSWGTCNISEAGCVQSGQTYCIGASLASCDTNRSFFHYVNGYNYSHDGNLVSRSFDVGFDTSTWLWNWSTFYASGTIPSGGASVTYQTQTSSDSSCSTCWDSLVSVSSGSSPTSTVRRYFRYKASFSATNTSTSPVLNYVEQNMTGFLRPGGTFYSDVHNIGTSITSWDTFLVTKQDNGGEHNFSIRAASGVFSFVSSTPTWTSLSAGAVPIITTGAYVQIRDVFVATKSTQNPTLNDFTVSWFEGQASDKAYGSYFRDAIWWSVASGVSVSTNNRILRLDLINSDWYLYDIGTNGMLVRNNSLYFGSSTEGKIFKFGDTDNDDGEAINAYWKSKDYVLGNPFVTKEFVNLSVSAGSVDNSSATVTYAIDGGSETAYQFPLYAGVDFFKHFNKNLPLGKQGNTFNVKVGNDGADQPFEVFAIRFGFREKPWKPTP